MAVDDAHPAGEANLLGSLQEISPSCSPDARKPHAQLTAPVPFWVRFAKWFEPLLFFLIVATADRGKAAVFGWKLQNEPNLWRDQ